MDKKVEKWYEEQLANFKEIEKKSATERIKILIDSTCNKLELPIADQAYELLKSLRAKGFTAGIPLPIAVATAIYLAGKITNQPVILKEIADVLDVDKDRLGKAIRLAATKYGVKTKVLRPEVYVSRIAKKLGLSEKISEDAKELLKNFRVPDGKKPEPFAAAAIYLAALKNGEKIGQEQVAEVVYTNEVSVREALKSIKS
jgi:transcription initiation factor TFIIB